MNWRDVIHEFLTACAENSRARFLVEGDSPRSKYILKSGTEDMVTRESERLRKNIVESAGPIGSSEKYRLVVEQPNLIIAEVDPAGNRHPFRLTRFRLVVADEQWKLDEILIKCSCTEGACSWCDGTGKCSVCGGGGDCKFCDGSSECQLCKGAYLCSICESSAMPGWNRMA